MMPPWTAPLSPNTMPLPDRMIFRVHLNSSCDVHAGPDVKLFPEDSSDDRAVATKHLDEEDAAEQLVGWEPGIVVIDTSIVAP